VAHLTFPTDDYSLDFSAVSRTKYGALLAKVTARHGDQVLHMARFDLLNQRDQEHFDQRCRSVNGTVADWQSRLQAGIPSLEQLVTIEDARTSEARQWWTDGQTAADLLAQEEVEVVADARDLLVPGCITIVAAPRASGKSIVALYLGLMLAQGGVFRGERVPQRRVALVDRDNPPAIVRKRLGWLGGHQVSTLTVFTRDKAPPLTDAEAWGAFPVEHYDVVIVDSIGAATEGVSEKEGKLTQQYLATLKDLAQRGPAILALDNTNKAASNYRGRGEKGDAVDILYECRNITGWTPTEPVDWWEHLPDFGEHAWQQRASRRKGQPVLQIAFIPSKFRLGVDPEPFVLEVDTREDPWTLDDITEDIASAGQQAAADAAQRARATLLHAEAALVQALRTRPPDHPMLKREAEHFLSAQGLRQRVACTLLKQGGNRDLYPAGPWVLRAIPGARGGAIGVYLAGEEDRERNNQIPKSPRDSVPSQPSISFTGSTPCEQNTATTNASKYADETDPAFRSQRGYTMNEIDSHSDKEICASPEGGIISFTDTPSSEEPCLHEHVNDLGCCNDCSEVLDL
jgi:hypothetical protein